MSKFDEETNIPSLETRIRLADLEFARLEALKGGAINVTSDAYRNILERHGLDGEDMNSYIAHCLEMEAIAKSETREIRLNTIKFVLTHPFTSLLALINHLRK